MHEAGVGLAVMPPPEEDDGTVLSVVADAGSMAKAGEPCSAIKASPKIRMPKKPKPERVKYLGNQNPCCLHFINI